MGVGGWTAPADTCVLPELLLFNSTADKLGEILITGCRSMLHMKATSTCSLLKCHLDAAEKSPQILDLQRLGGSI